MGFWSNVRGGSSVQVFNQKMQGQLKLEDAYPGSILGEQWVWILPEKSQPGLTRSTTIAILLQDHETEIFQ
ncbi:hypothetical protein LINPERHAP1_LOCUS4063 [Linum perenne]